MIVCSGYDHINEDNTMRWISEVDFHLRGSGSVLCVVSRHTREFKFGRGGMCEGLQFQSDSIFNVIK